MLDFFWNVMTAVGYITTLGVFVGMYFLAKSCREDDEDEKFKKAVKKEIKSQLDAVPTGSQWRSPHDKTLEEVARRVESYSTCYI